MRKIIEVIDGVPTADVQCPICQKSFLAIHGENSEFEIFPEVLIERGIECYRGVINAMCTGEGHVPFEHEVKIPVLIKCPVAVVQELNKNTFQTLG